MEQRQEEVELDLLEIFYLLWDKIVILIAATVLGAVLLGSYTKLGVQPLYESTAKLYILSQSTSLTTLADVQMGTQLTQDYMELIKSRPVVGQVIENLNLNRSYEEVLSQLAINNKANTRILGIRIQDADAEAAKVIADEFANVSKSVISEIMCTDEPNVVQYGHIAEKPFNINTLRNIAIGALLGLFAAAAIIIVLYVIDDRIKSSEDIEKYLGLNTLTAIPLSEEEKKTVRKDRWKRKYGGAKRRK